MNRKGVVRTGSELLLILPQEVEEMFPHCALRDGATFPEQALWGNSQYDILQISASP